MKRVAVIRTAAAGFVLAALLASATPAAAYEFRGNALYARFGPSAEAGQGLIVVDGIGTSAPRLNGTFVGLPPGVEQSIDLRSIRCDGTPAASNRILTFHGTATANRELIYSAAVSGSPDYSRVRSAWSSAGSAHTCVRVTRSLQVATGDVTGDDVLGLVKTGPGTLTFLAERRPSGRARLTIVVAALGGDFSVQLRATTTACGTPYPSSAVVYSDTFPAALKTGTVSLAAARLRSIRAVWVHHNSTGFNGCAPAVIMANTEGDFH